MEASEHVMDHMAEQGIGPLWMKGPQLPIVLNTDRKRFWERLSCQANVEFQCSQTAVNAAWLSVVSFSGHGWLLSSTLRNLKGSEGQRSDPLMFKVRHESQEEPERKSCWKPAGSALFIGSWNVVVLLVINCRQHSHMPLMHEHLDPSPIEGVTVFDGLRHRFV